MEQIKYVYFIGVGGIGMSGLARYFKHIGCEVAGYDKTDTSLTRTLISEGIEVIYADDYALVPDVFKSVSEEVMIVYTPAVPADLQLLNAFKNSGHHILKRAQVLGKLSEGQYTIAIAGTHGKTTTSSMVAHILTDSGYGCSAFLGGITANYQTNTLFSDKKTLVVEADEYDRSFLTLHPDVAIITSADADHLDIYGEHEALLQSFGEFLGQVTPQGFKIVHQGLPFDADVYYSAEGQGAVYADNIRIDAGQYYFDYFSESTHISHIALGIPGLHNVANAVAAITAALHVGVQADAIKSALASFKGVKRRFEYIVRNDAHIYIDDYAHHPTELNACLQAVRSLYPDKHVTIIFQPHLYTRTRDFMVEFAQALSEADTVILMEIYPARELPIPGIDAQALLDRITSEKKMLLDRSEIVEYVQEYRPELLVTMGAGNIDQLVNPLKEVLADG